jgi:sn-1 stearoyl-lipid 9-desaturase
MSLVTKYIYTSGCPDKYIYMNSHFYKIILPLWIFSLVAIYFLITNFQWTHIWYTLLGLYVPGIVGNTIGFHRYLTHQSFEVNKFWHYTFILLGSLTGQGSAIFWTALHLHHHRNSDNNLDVHSPNRGFLHSFILWQIRGKFEGMKGLIAPKKLYKDPVIKFLHYQYYKVYWGTGLMLLMIDPFFFLYFFCLGAFFLMSLVDNFSNFFLHYDKVGYTNYDTKDNSRNVPLIAYLTLGGGWHNNHHNDPKNYKFGITKYEIDLASKFIEIIKK